MQNASVHLLRPGTGLQLQPAVASSQLAAQGQPAAAYQAAAAAASAQRQLSGMMERFTDKERKQLAFSVLIAGASVLSSAQMQQQGIQAADMRQGSMQASLGCGQLDLGSCSRTGTPASLQAASMRDAGHAYLASKCIGQCPVQYQGHQGGCHGQRVQGTMPAALEDSTSPLSSNSFALIGGVLTPSEAESVSAARVGCKRSYDAVEQQQQYQQVLLSHQQQQARTHQLQPAGMALARQQQSAGQVLVSQQQLQARQHQAMLLLKQRQAAQQQQAQLQKQAAAQQQYQASQLQQQLAAQQQQQHQQMQTLLAAGQHLASGPHASAVVQDAVAAAAAAAAAASRAYGAAAASAAHQQQLLMPQGSGTSISSGFSSATAAAPAGTSAVGAASASSIWQQLVQAQERKCQLSAAPSAAAALPSLHAHQQAVPLLGSASSITTSSSSTSSSGGIFSSYLQQQQQAAKRRVQQQPPAKRAATQAAVAALLGASAAHSAQQLAATQGSSNSLQALALLPSQIAAGAHLTASPRRVLADTNSNRLLQWAGQILGCQLQDAYHLAAHIFKRTAGRLDDMLLISLGASLPVDSVTMLVALWLATKLEGHRRQVAGCSKLAAALQLLPWAVTSIELHMMQLMDWQPYAGWALRPQEPSCSVTLEF